ncbi:DUF3443 family protein [Paraburkholderia sp. BCC1885]|uniref:DUF3443 family protein n=1 Tax=Paraburkholderia sp. BCC1885 TaxID=2562669 RepID=UPI0011838B79|nr:DUF3443 family protein [Paraburkholderia sp. BCC1885]
MRQIAWIIAVTLGLCVAGCGGGGGNNSSAPAATNSSNSPSTTSSPVGNTPDTAASNALAVDASAVPTAVNSTNAIPVTVSNTGIPNQPMVSVTVCGSGSATTGNCTTIPNVLLDTGSYGLRLFRSVIPDSTFSAFAPVTDSGSGLPLAECAVFVSAYGWGTVHQANVKLGSEIATQVPILVMADPALTAPPPSPCVTGTELTAPAALGANGILGVGPNVQDCGIGCVLATQDQFYYTSAGNVTTAPIAKQVANPAAMFTQDNNGLILEMAQVADSGAATGSGTLVFGIDTQSNNALQGTSATLIPTDSGGNFTAAFNGATLQDGAFFDSGSTAMFFGDTSIDHASSNESSLYIPATTVGRMATLFTGSASTASVGFNIANGLTLSASGNNAFNDIGAFSSGTLDFGLPFFYGRHVYYGFAGKTSSGGGTGPYVAYVSN